MDLTQNALEYYYKTKQFPSPHNIKPFKVKNKNTEKSKNLKIQKRKRELRSIDFFRLLIMNQIKARKQRNIKKLHFLDINKLTLNVLNSS